MLTVFNRGQLTVYHYYIITWKMHTTIRRLELTLRQCFHISKKQTNLSDTLEYFSYPT